ncbi:Putative portal protein [Exiguobacterium sp. 8H]|nr:putative portal protein [Exiguobacterium sp. 8A]VXB52715.1 Putative portal protein [Exiguobacterium sp. 8H]
MFKTLWSRIKGVLHSMGFIKGIAKVTDIQGTTVSDEMYQAIDRWLCLYQGNVESFSWSSRPKLVWKVQEDGKSARVLRTLNLPKLIAQEMAQLTFNEKFVLNISDERIQSFIDETFKMNKFGTRMQEHFEVMYATGGVAVEAYVEGGAVRLNYIHANSFYPIAWDSSGKVSEAVIISDDFVQGNERYRLLRWHVWEKVGDQKLYTIRNRLYKADRNDKDDIGIEVSLDSVPRYADVEAVISIQGLKNPLFAYTKPATKNNVDITSPLGISLFANAIDTIHTIDYVFDSFENEFSMGKKRILASEQVLETVDEKGQLVTRFNADTSVYTPLNFGDTDTPIKEIDFSLRVEEHLSAINGLLETLSAQIGFSSGTFTFDGQSVKTATEIISEKSKTYRTKQTNEVNSIEPFIRDIVAMILDVATAAGLIPPPGDYEINVAFDDSIAEDKKATTELQILRVGAGLQSKLDAIMLLDRLDEEAAREKLRRIQEEERAVMTRDPLMSGIGEGLDDADTDPV